MAGHVREKSYKPTTTISLSQSTLSKIEDYRFSKRKDNRSQAIEEIMMYGFKYLALVEKKKQRERMTV